MRISSTIGPGGRTNAARGRTPGRRSRRREAGGVPIAVNFAPMIDVTFLLLIFFLVTTSFERAEGLLTGKMPADSSAASVPLPLSPIVVRLSQGGWGDEGPAIHIDGFDSSLAGFDELAVAIRGIHEKPGFDEETPLVIVAGNEVMWDHVVGCWNAALRAGCKRVAFGEPQ